MFDSLGKEGQRDAGKYLTSMLISLVVHTAVLSLLIVMPMVFLNVLHADELITILYPLPSVPVAPPPPVAPTTHRSNDGEKIYRVDINQTPVGIPKGIHPELEAPPEEPGIYMSITGVSSVPQGNATGAAIGDILAKMKEPTVVEPPKPPVRRPPIRVSGPIQEGKLLHRVDPVYPKLAIVGRISATVVLEAVIDEEGSVTDLKIIEGHPLFNEAAENAVRQWKYRPTLIGGEPVPVLANITLIFRIR